MELDTKFLFSNRLSIIFFILKLILYLTKNPQKLDLCFLSYKISYFGFFLHCLGLFVKPINNQNLLLITIKYEYKIKLGKNYTSYAPAALLMYFF